MNILAMENDLRERALILQALDGKTDSVTITTSSAQTLQAIRGGEVRLLIANYDNTDLSQTGLVRQIRALNSEEPVYILLITSKISEENESSKMADDILHRPYSPKELKTRVDIARRIITLTASLAVARAQVENQAIFEPLTGFMNQSGFLRQAAGELERSRRASNPLSLIALDIDNFKAINDTYGAKVGDGVLKVVAKTIREKSRPYDCVGHWAGDEFVIALPGVIGADAEKVAERVIAGVRATRVEVQNEAPLNLKISAGIASVMRIASTTEVEPLIQSARQAVARAKEAGGNQVFLVFL